MMRFYLILFPLFLLFSSPALAEAGEVVCKDSTKESCSIEGPPASLEKPLEALTFERVVDGDTLKASGRTIRLWGIDTPEKDEPNYLAATWYLETIVKDGELSCRFIEKDRYKRDVMHCFIDGNDIGSMMVQMGMAKNYERYSGGYYAKEQELAKAQGRGIWKQGVVTPVSQKKNIFTSKCGSKTYCKEMKNCAEAKFYLFDCGLTRLDGDGDGVPCETICN